MIIKQEKLAEYIATIEQLSSRYKEVKEVINGDTLSFLSGFRQKFEHTLDEKMRVGRKLSLGIVGVVKAGKSSFLNSLLFEGKDVLPEAATPMTAALTIINYAENPYAEVEYYSQSEWDIIVEKSVEYAEKIKERRQQLRTEKCNDEFSDHEIASMMSMSDILKSAQELVSLANSNGIQPLEFLGKQAMIEDVNTVNDLMGRLVEYVGVSGRYTPLVKSLKLYLNIETLKELQIVDTPGMNDPIVSRGLATKNYLSECDSVFFISYAGHFLSSEDVNVLFNELPANGIKRFLLIGSKIDSVLLGIKNKKFEAAYVQTARELKQHAETILGKFIKERANDCNVEVIKSNMKPVFISSMMYQIAKKYPNLNANQRNIYETLKKRYVDFEFTPKVFMDLSGIDDIESKEITEIRADKEKIMQASIQDFIIGQKKLVHQKLVELKKNVELNYITVKNGEIGELERKIKETSANIRSASTGIHGVFEQSIHTIIKKLHLLESDIKLSSSQYKRIQIEQRTRTYDIQVNVPERFLLFFTRNRVESRTKTETYEYALVYDAVEKVQDFIYRIEKDIRNEISSLLDYEILYSQITSVILPMFDISDEKFNIDDIRMPVKRTVSKITIPMFAIDSSSYVKRVIEKFGSGSVTGESAYELQYMQSQVVSEILEDMGRSMNSKVAEISEHMEKAKLEFVDQLIGSMVENVDQLKEQIVEKEKYLQMYEKAIEMITDDINRV